mgnify:CR=1 FL=1
MKQILPVIVAAIIGGVAGLLLSGGDSNSATGDADSTSADRIAELETQLKAAKAQSGRVELVETEKETVVEKVVEITPAEYIDNLKQIRPRGETRQQSMREIIHYMVGLTKAGDPALPAIKAFLETGSEIEYEAAAQDFDRQQREAREAQSRGEEAKPSGIGQFIKSGFGSYFMTSLVTQMDRELEPGSLRLGLFDVTHDIGGPDAEAILAGILETTGRGLEVAYLDRILSDMNPGEYENKVLAAVHELLTNPPETRGDSLLDETSRMFLFALLVKYKDATFVDTAKTQIINAEGRVDGAVVNYLTTILGVDAVPLLYAKVKDESLTDDGDKMALGDAILKHVGTNDDSNAFFTEVVTNEELGPLRFLALGHLTGGDRAESTLRNRQKLIADIKAKSPEDAALNRALDNTHNRLEVMIDPSKAGELGTGDRPNLFELFNRGRQQNN